ncbi:alpha/beta-hydrolase [Jaminaea rosea]|uniref:Alpha/beta-hydrolase n=1 Tax=Jaminaea rosea TaxID=1569628 RepID=A0A316UYR3_9BASI|nr:alpha/beta-hydrolase [Jaminaea rosea]PWN29928.1 alpha/beta-hydrolase [Jaminaea rosea]
MLLNAAPIAEGWNKLLGAVRTGSSLQDDVREIMILRVAARNRASFEWIHHEPVARKAGVTTEQLTRIGDVSKTSSSSLTAAGKGQLSPLQAAATVYADKMTSSVKVDEATFESLKHELGKVAGTEGEKLNQLLVEATGTTAVYNMVSRFLVALDVDDRANEPVPVPGLPPSLSSSSSSSTPQQDLGPATGRIVTRDGLTLATRTHFHSMKAPWLLLINSLITNVSMWDSVVPLLASRYNILCYDQRGHGSSAIPDQPCTVEQLADDAADVLSALGIDKAKAVIGVSQGGATALSFAISHPERTECIIANDTQAASPEANFHAWEDRIALAKREGMEAIAKATVARWYGEEEAGDEEEQKAREKAHAMIVSTELRGFEQGARALQKYDLLQAGLLEAIAKKPTLLIAGEKDGALPKGLAALAEKVKEAQSGATVAFQAIEGASHLPMLDRPEKWCDVVLRFLESQ